MTSPAPLRLPCWRELIEEQDKVLARRQALRSGLSEDAWQWRLDKGLWTPLLPGVVAAHSGEPTDGQRAWAAVLRAGDDAALSGDAGLVALGFRLNELRAVDVAVPDRAAGRGHPMPAGPPYRPHSVTGLTRMLHPVRLPPVVRVPFAVLHAAAWAVSDRAAEWRLAAVVQQRLVTAADIRDALESMPKLPRRALIRVVLDDVERGAHAGSELDFLRLCRRNAIPEPDELNVLVRAGGKRYLDGRYRRQRVSVEVDGAHHRWVEQWDADVLRANDLAVSARGRGQTQLRFTAGNLRHEEARVAAQLRAALR